MKLLTENPLAILIVIILSIIILIAIFRTTNLTAGVGMNAHIGQLRGSFQLEAFESGKTPVFVVVYAEWCGHCKRFMPEYQKLMSSYDKINGVKLYALDSEDPKNRDMIGKMGVKGFPTIRYYPKGLTESFHDYEGDRSAQAIMAYLENQDVVGVQDVAPDFAAPVDRM